MKRTSAKLNRDEILTVRTLAEYLQCHPSTLYRMLKERTIPAFKLGSDWRFFRAEIDRWVRASTIGPTR